jgi:poly(A) polymerase
MEKTAVKIVKTFQEAGFETYFAGGSVRDLLMEKEPQDYDIATSAKPDEIERLVDAMHLESKTIPIGKQFGVILGIVHGHEFEIATFRSDSSTSDGRRPDAVLFTSAKEDAVRRDFTINGLFYDPIKKKVIDFVDGQKDIQEKVIRFIGEPHERIKEDHLRLLRAIRFANNFGFEYDPLTLKAVKELSHLVEDVSRERVRDELNKMLVNENRAHSIRELEKFGMLEHILPEVYENKGVRQPVQFHQEGGVLTHTLKALHDMPKDWVFNEDGMPNLELIWAIFLHDVGKAKTYQEKPDRIHFDGHAKLSAQMAEVIMRRLKFSKFSIAKTSWLIHNHMTIGSIPKMRRAHQVDLFWHPWFPDLMKLHYCDEHGSIPIDLSLYENVMKLYEECINEKQLEDHFKPKLTGDEVMEITGLSPGPEIKEILQELRNAQIEGLVTDRGQAEEFVLKMKTK